jgi:3-oxoacyl-[acyl-carrier protein] reductase
MTVQDRIAIVTGAGRGIGAATGRELAAQGASVALVDIDLEPVQELAAEIQKNGGEARAFQCDVSSVAQIEKLAAEVIATYGRIDILVNNAAICPRIPIAEMTDEWFDRIMGVNVKSVFFLTRVAADDMKQREWGRIVNITSTAGRIGALFNATVYSASKGAVAMMTKSMAREYAASGVLINCVAPGAVDTRMQSIDDETRDRYTETVPLRRFADPVEIARSIVHLCSEETSFVTGATLDVNGGVVMV